MATACVNRQIMYPTMESAPLCQFCHKIVTVDYVCELSDMQTMVKNPSAGGFCQNM